MAGFASPFPRKDSEEKLLARIERQQNLVKKAKLEVRLGRVKLLQAIDAYDQGDFERCWELLNSYLDRMKSAWQHLQDSGRPAWRKPQGFKQLDIGLRRDSRFLEDLKHRIPYEERSPVEKVQQEVDALRNTVLRALFPPERPRKAGKNFVGGNAQHFSQGAGEGWNP